ncbi:hypothetical protein [Fervidibacter sacchari]
MRKVRGLICLWVLPLLFVVGCERVKRGEVAVQPAEVVKVPKPRVKPKKAEQPQAEVAQQPTVPEAAAPETAAPETAAPQPTAPEATQLATTQPTPTQPTPQPTTPQPAPKPEVTQPPAPTAAEVAAVNFADEARSVRASADTLHSQFDRLPVGEIRSRLLLLNQAVSELEVRSPALVLWRTALRLEVTSKAPYPDVASARAWIARARAILTEQKVGLTALANAEAALKTGDWKGAAAALRDAANRLKASEQAEALTQARVCLLNAMEALERQKSSVAKAEVGEAVKALDRLIASLP